MNADGIFRDRMHHAAPSNNPDEPPYGIMPDCLGDGLREVIIGEFGGDFNGYIDEFIMYDRVLSGSEIAAHSNGNYEHCGW